MNLTDPHVCPFDLVATVGECQTNHCDAEAFGERERECFRCPSGRRVRFQLAEEGRRIHAEAELLARDDYQPAPIVDASFLDALGVA